MKNNIWVVAVLDDKSAYPYGAEDARTMLQMIKPEHMDCKVRTFTYFWQTIKEHETLRDVCNYLSKVCENDSKAIQTACEQKLKNLALEKEKAENEPHTKAQGHLEYIEEQEKATELLQTTEA